MGVRSNIAGAPGYGREFVDVFNATKKSFISMIMTTMQLTGAAYYES